LFFFVKTFPETPPILHLSSPKVKDTPIKALHGSQTKYGFESQLKDGKPQGMLICWPCLSMQGYCV